MPARGVRRPAARADPRFRVKGYRPEGGPVQDVCRGKSSRAGWDEDFHHFVPLRPAGPDRRQVPQEPSSALRRRPGTTGRLRPGERVAGVRHRLRAGRPEDRHGPLLPGNRHGARSPRRAVDRLVHLAVSGSRRAHDHPGDPGACRAERRLLRGRRATQANRATAVTRRTFPGPPRGRWAGPRSSIRTGTRWPTQDMPAAWRSRPYPLRGLPAKSAKGATKRKASSPRSLPPRSRPRAPLRRGPSG